jgi:pimeloyl-ACP methyl ester carboxylesterase
MGKRGILTALMGLLILAVAALPVLAQGGEGQAVQVEAEDGLSLVGDYYAPSGEVPEMGAAGVLLLHMLGSNRASWADLIPPLQEAGYAVLAVDMRGHGQTGGPIDWPLAETDVQTWLDWLRAQEGVDPARVSLVGASIGSNLALRGMANDPDVLTAVALSPGLDYQDVTTQDAIEAIDDRPVMLVAGQGDTYSAQTIKQLTQGVGGEALTRLYASRAHGTQMFATQPDLIDLIVAWLDWQTAPAD